MRQVRIRVTCDACQAWHDSENEDGVQTVAVAGGQTLDLCPSHRSDLAPFLNLVAEWGAAPTAQGSKRGRTPTAPNSSPVAPAATGNLPSKRGGKRARQRRANAEQQAPGAALPVSGDLPLTCPLCQGIFSTPDSLGVHTRMQHGRKLTDLYGGTCPVCAHQGDPRGLGTHGARHHQSPSAAHLFALAQQQGDPHGVLAARAEAVAAQH
jgi:hypothetical protein